EPEVRLYRGGTKLSRERGCTLESVITGAVADCERILEGFWGQPVNALTSLGFSLAGAWLIRRRPERRMVGIALIGVGLGSFLFHGPMPPGAQWAHDVTLGWLLVVVGLDAIGRIRYAWPALAILGLVIAVAPGLADPLAVAGTIFVVGAFLFRPGWRTSIPPLLLLGLAAVAGRLGRHRRAAVPSRVPPPDPRPVAPV